MFKLPKKTARLVFDGDYQGLEVTVRLNVPIRTYLAIQDMSDKNKLLDILQEFARIALVGWNVLDEKDEPVPATVEGLLSIEPGMVTRIVAEWSAAVVKPPAPLAEPSADGSM